MASTSFYEQAVKSVVVDIFARAREGVAPIITLHTLIQNEITRLANRYGLKALKEYRLKNLWRDGRDGLIDVVWFSDSKPIAVFEIDSRLRTKSIKKLL